MSDTPDPSPNEEDARRWRDEFEASKAGLRAFLRTRLSQDSDVDDCLQVVFLKMVERGGAVAPAARRSWLFRVAANESARMWRAKASTDKMIQKQGVDPRDDSNPITQAILAETTRDLRRAIDQLPPPWQQVIHLRIHENLTFQQIANRLEIPLGTALTQMRRSLERLKQILEQDES